MSTFEQKANTKWSQEEINILVDYIKQYPDNRAEAYRRTSLEVKRPPKAVEQKFYNTIFNNKNLLVSFHGSEKGVSINRKNTPVKEGERFKRDSKLSPMAVVIQQLLNMNPEDKKFVREFLNRV